MGRTTYVGYLRQFGGSSRKKSTPVPLVACVQFDFDPTAASSATGKILPKGAIPLWVSNINGGATGAGTVDIGTASSPAGFADELAAEAVSAPVATGSLLGVELTADTEIYAGVGALAAPGGTVKAAVYYVMADDGSQ